MKGEAIPVDGRYYWIGERLGAGSFGEVYACTDEWQNSLVAKILLPRDRPYAEIRESWQRECSRLLELRHPNITYVHSAFEYKDTFYIVLERCALTLNDLINHPNLTPDVWIPHVARDVLQGLDYLHQFRYVHKDVHPGNVMVSQSFDRMVPDREPVWSFKIGDLGIANLEESIQGVNSIFAQWMLPPEVIDPTFGSLGKGVDIYHTGLLLLGLATKTTPAFTTEEIVAGRPREAAENCGSQYAGPIAKALRRHVDSRTATAMDFWRDIMGVGRPTALSELPALQVEPDAKNGTQNSEST